MARTGLTDAIAGALLVASLVLLQCRSAPAMPADEQTLRTIVKAAIVDDVVPAAHRFLAQAKDLKATVSGCKDEGKLGEPVRQRFRDLAAAWGNLSVARFGPLTENSRYERIAFWPDPRGVIRRQTSQLKASIPPTREAAIEWIAHQSAAVQGLPAFDLLAFGDEATRSCPMAAAVAANIERLAAEVDLGFADPERLALLAPSAESPLYRSYEDSLAEVMRALSTQSDVVRVTMISELINRPVPAGAASAPNSASKPARLFLSNAPATRVFLAGAIDGLQGLLAATKLEGLLSDETRGLPERARQELQTARTLLEALPTDFGTALDDAATQSKLAGAATALERFNRIINAGIAPALGLKAGFNALDGD